jgi:hypothetical protein
MLLTWTSIKHPLQLCINNCKGAHSGESASVQEWISDFIARLTKLLELSLIHSALFHRTLSAYQKVSQYALEVNATEEADLAWLGCEILEHCLFLDLREEIFKSFTDDEYFYPIKIEQISMRMRLSANDKQKILLRNETQAKLRRFVVYPGYYYQCHNVSMVCRMKLLVINPKQKQERIVEVIKEYETIFPMLRRIAGLANLNVTTQDCLNLEHQYESLYPIMTNEILSSHSLDAPDDYIVDHFNQQLTEIHGIGCAKFKDFIGYVKNRWELSKSDTRFNF